MKDGGGDPTQSSDGLLQRSSLTDVIFLVVVIGVIVAAILFRGTHRTERATPAKTGAAAATVPEGRPGGIPFAIPGARDDVKRDLRNLVTAQEWVFADSIHYVDDVSLLTRERGLILTSGATIRIVWADAMSWAAARASSDSAPCRTRCDHGRRSSIARGRRPCRDATGIRKAP